MIEIIFEAHGTTFDNEAHLSSGHNDVGLSSLGIQQSKEMGIRYKDDHFDAVFCSDLQRAYKIAEIGFGTKWPIIKDARLRECNYGDFTQHPSSEVDVEKPNRIHTPFPNGESYEQTTLRMKDFLNYLRENYEGKRVMIIGHRATLGLDAERRKLPVENKTRTELNKEAFEIILLKTKEMIIEGTNLIIDCGVFEERVALFEDIAQTMNVKLLKFFLKAPRDILLARVRARDKASNRVTDVERFDYIYELIHTKKFDGFTIIETDNISPEEVVSRILGSIV